MKGHDPLLCLVIALGSLCGSGTAAADLPIGPPFKPTPSVRILTTDGATLEVLGAESAPFDMVRITMADGTYRYIAPVRIETVVDESGVDRTRALLNDRRKVGTPLPPALAPPEPGLRVGPLPVTRFFLTTETTALGRLGGTGVSGAGLDFDMGMLWNVAENTGVGGTVFVGAGTPYDFNAGFRLRVRRWLSRTASIDVSPGVIAAGRMMSSRPAVPPGYSLQVSLSPSRYLSLTTEIFSVPRRAAFIGTDDFHGYYLGEIQDTGILMGIRVGQWPGAVAGVLPLFASLFTSSINVTY